MPFPTFKPATSSGAEMPRPLEKFQRLSSGHTRRGCVDPHPFPARCYDVGLRTGASRLNCEFGNVPDLAWIWRARYSRRLWRHRVDVGSADTRCSEKYRRLVRRLATWTTITISSRCPLLAGRGTATLTLLRHEKLYRADYLPNTQEHREERKKSQDPHEVTVASACEVASGSWYSFQLLRNRC